MLGRQETVCTKLPSRQLPRPVEVLVSSRVGCGLCGCSGEWDGVPVHRHRSVSLTISHSPIASGTWRLVLELISGLLLKGRSSRDRQRLVRNHRGAGRGAGKRGQHPERANKGQGLNCLKRGWVHRTKESARCPG